MSSSSSASLPFIIFRFSRTGLETTELQETWPNGILSSRLPSLSFSLRRSDLSGDLDLRLSDGSALRDLRWLLARFLASCSSKTSIGIFRFFCLRAVYGGQWAEMVHLTCLLLRYFGLAVLVEFVEPFLDEVQAHS